MCAPKQEEEYGYDIPIKRSELHYLPTEIALTTRSIKVRSKLMAGSPSAFLT
jgi:hypothetical protein